MKSMKSIAVTAAALAGIASAGTGVLYAAQSPSNAVRNPVNGIVNAIATKFNLNASDVQSVFDEHRRKAEETVRTEHETRIKAELDQAVTDGKLTREQADKIIAKRQELATLKTDLKNGTPEEHRAAMEARMESLKTWAKENNVPVEYLLSFGGKMKTMGAGQRMIISTERLDQAVKDGKLTQTQRDQIVTKEKELQIFMQTLKDKTPEERTALVKTKIAEIKQWAADNKLPTEYLVSLAFGEQKIRGSMRPMHGKDAFFKMKRLPEPAAPSVTQ